MKEEWMIIPDFPNYSVSNLGNVKNNKTNRIRKPQYNHAGYRKIGIHRDGRRYMRRIARLVLLTFKPPKCDMEVNHIDHVRDNDSLNNLEWVTHSTNVKQSWKRRKIDK